ncbi:serine protease inhibitor 77Ba-like [Epargyreus clarus]|uniref:serine protease inhibitor 77Ba-like n=1 Tax=Epargyreus clarus TaxID=520877 RepID=UPI003C2B9372
MITLSVFAIAYLFSAVPCNAQNVYNASTDLHHGLSEKIGNFSIELLYHVTQQEQNNKNLIISPVTAWTLLAVTAEGATEKTLRELCSILRIVPNMRKQTRADFKKIFQWLQVQTNTVDLVRYNAIFANENKLLERDFVEDAAEYDTKIIPANFSDAENTARVVNSAISAATNGRISKIISSEDLMDSQMIMTSVLYFKGQWTSPFNASMTTKMPFYSSSGERLGDVNMMYNRYTYPFANIKALQARVIEIPYGKENRLSMLIMLPHPGVSLQDMFLNFNNVSFDKVFTELKRTTEEFGEEEVDCFIPRFKISTDLDLTNTLKFMGIRDLFDESRARLPRMSRLPLYVSKISHKAEIEVTEEGTTAAAVTTAEFSNRISIIRFEASRPFCYLIVEKTTNSIAFGGFYNQPTLY